MENQLGESQKEIPGVGASQQWFAATNYTVQQRFFLGRLERLVGLQATLPESGESWRSSLLSRAIYSTFSDCLALDLNREAQILLHGGQQAEESSSTVQER